MALDIQTLHEWFSYFNRLCFQDKLPMPRLMLSKSRTQLGSMTYRRSRRYVVFSEQSFTIRVSTYYESSEAELQDVLLHEMIHYFIALNKLRDTSPHGVLFRRMMKEINEKHRRNITVSTCCAGKSVASSARKQRERLVLALEMESGQCFLAVVNPRYAVGIRQRLEFVSGLKRHHWLVSKDPFFADFPAVRSLRARQVSRDEFSRRVAEGIPFSF